MTATFQANITRHSSAEGSHEQWTSKTTKHCCLHLHLLLPGGENCCLHKEVLPDNNCNLQPRALKYLLHWPLICSINSGWGVFRVCSLIIAQLRSPTKFNPWSGCPATSSRNDSRADELTQSGAGVTLHYWPRHRPLSKPTNQPRCTTYDTKYDRGGCCSFNYQYQAFLAADSRKFLACFSL